jgi:uncharacterized protein YbcI
MEADDPGGVRDEARRAEFVAARRHGALTTRISNGVVHLIATYTGRGPTRARTTIDGRLIICFVEDVLTKSEHSLLEQGAADTVLTIRQSVQEAMKGELVALVEGLTGRKVVAVLSATHTNPDCGLEAFVLDSDMASPRPAGPPT